MASVLGGQNVQHPIHINHAIVQECNYVVHPGVDGALNDNTSVGYNESNQTLNIVDLVIEDGPSGYWYTPTYHYYEDITAFAGFINYHRALQVPGTTLPGPLLMPSTGTESWPAINFTDTAAPIGIWGYPTAGVFNVLATSPVQTIYTSAATEIVMPTVTGSYTMLMQWRIRLIIYDAGTPEVLTYLNTENSTISPPAITPGSSGYTKACYVDLQADPVTKKWRCVASV